MKRNLYFELNITDSGGAPLAPTPQPVSTSSQPIKPVQPSAPSADVLKQTFSSADMPELDSSEGKAIIEDKHGRPVAQPEKKEETVKASEKKVVTFEAKTEKEEVKKEEENPVSKFLKPPTTGEKKDEKKVEVKGDGVKRVEVPSKDDIDYTSFSQQEVGYLKNMSIPARKFTADLIKQNRELAKNKDGVYYQHPQAYTLLPEYKQAEQDVTDNYQVGQYLETQLKLVKLGKPFRPPTGWDNKGKLVLGNEVTEYDADVVEERMRREVGNYYGQAQQKQQQLQQFAGTFQQGIQRDTQLIEQERSKRFAWAADPKLLDHTIEIEGMGERSIRQIREDIINIFPPYQRHTPGVQVCADMMVAMRLQAAELAEAKAQSSLSQTKMEEVQRAEPSSSGRPESGGKAFGGVKNFDATILDSIQ